MPAAVSVECRRRILELTVLGWSARRIAQELGVCERTVDRVRVAVNGVVLAVRPFTVGEVARVEELLADGWSYTEIGRELGRSAAVICKRWPGRGWSLKQCGEYANLLRRSGEVLK